VRRAAREPASRWGWCCWPVGPDGRPRARSSAPARWPSMAGSRSRWPPTRR
jgi:hypothetical protein